MTNKRNHNWIEKERRRENTERENRKPSTTRQLAAVCRVDVAQPARSFRLIARVPEVAEDALASWVCFTYLSAFRATPGHALPALQGLAARTASVGPFTAFTAKSHRDISATPSP